MSDELQTEPPVLSMRDVAHRPGHESESRWRRAAQVLGALHSELKDNHYDGSHFRVGPSVPCTFGGETMNCAVAILVDDTKNATPTYMLVLNGCVGDGITINRFVDPHGKTAYTMFNDGSPVSLADGDEILERLEALVQQRRDMAKKRSRDRKERVIDAWHWTWESTVELVLKYKAWIGLVVGTPIVGFFLLWGIASCTSSVASSDDIQRDKIYTFDHYHIGEVLKGQRIDIAKKVVLHSGGDYVGISVPEPMTNQPAFQMRSFKVPTGSCPTDPDADLKVRMDPPTFGRIDGNQYLLAETNAPDGVVTVQVSPSGKVYACATDPAKEGNTGPEWELLLQVQTVEPPK